MIMTVEEFLRSEKKLTKFKKLSVKLNGTRATNKMLKSADKNIIGEALFQENKPWRYFRHWAVLNYKYNKINGYSIAYEDFAILALFIASLGFIGIGFYELLTKFIH